MRVFFALGLNESVNLAAREALADYKNQLSGEGRAVPDANLHLTLAFLGDVPEAVLPALCEEANAIRLSSFSLTLSQLAVWSGPNIACATVATPPAMLCDLAHRLSQLAAWPAQRDSHAFTPHITLRRGVKTVQGLDGPPLPSLTFTCQRFGLYASPSHPATHGQRDSEGRALYQCLHAFDLTSRN
ncbi:2'-5' RNA ligase [Salinivibrio sp. PR5]|uniref:RNA 2',3'-cyclic phosphodiesterase n=1 Tax=Salinivibrio sp. PR5 TaxID=1909484 RepID=UPI00098ACCA9|nr:RNA 2',3'-cyclic phosphodiesterase [Salinivibrio sp. PR5]OOF12585.1 2'-5' RNA ligase [Salinivibrio sp. PR5]